MPYYQKIKRFVNYVLGPLLFVLIAFSIYQQLHLQKNLPQNWQTLKDSLKGGGRWWLLLSVLLMFVNWGIEAFKWKLLVNHLMPINYFKSLLSVLAGVSFTMLTPNRMGEFLGRVLYMPDGSRIRAATLTAMSSMSQLMITMLAGVVGVWILQHKMADSNEWPWLLTNVVFYGTLLVLVATVLLYFNIGSLIRLFEKWPPFSKYAFYVHAVGEIQASELMKILGISALRYLVFLVQYLAVFGALGIAISPQSMFAATAAMFLILAIVPSASLAELGIRGQTSLFVFGLFSTDSLGILVASGFIWFINIILPALAGSLILLSVKLFGKN